MSTLKTSNGGAQAPSFPQLSGVSLKPCHFEAILAERPDIGFFEIHAENYLSAGGPNRYYLDKIREHYPITIHGVGLSIGGENPINIEHLNKVAQLVDRIEPILFSEHLAWSSHDSIFLNDLLPLPYTQETLSRVCQHIEQIQDTLKHPILLENPSTYLQFQASEYDECEFIKLITQQTGCGLLFDINNVAVSCFNHGTSAVEYMKNFPSQAVKQIHLAGFSVDENAAQPLRIDSHDDEVDKEVWSLYQQYLSINGDTATLIEWDGKLPQFSKLQHQAHLADQIRRSLRETI